MVILSRSSTDIRLPGLSRRARNIPQKGEAVANRRKETDDEDEDAKLYAKPGRDKNLGDSTNINETPKRYVQSKRSPSRGADSITRSELIKIRDHLEELDKRIKELTTQQRKFQRLVEVRSRLYLGKHYFDQKMEHCEKLIDEMKIRLRIEKRDSSAGSRGDDEETGTSDSSDSGDSLEHDRELVKRILKKHYLELIYPDQVDEEVTKVVHKAIMDHSINGRRYKEPIINQTLVAVDLSPYEKLMPPGKATAAKPKTRSTHALFTKANELNRIMNGPIWAKVKYKQIYGGFLEAVFLKVQELAEKRLLKKAKSVETSPSPINEVARRSSRLAKKRNNANVKASISAESTKSLPRRKRRVAKSSK